MDDQARTMYLVTVYWHEDAGFTQIGLFTSMDKAKTAVDTVTGVPMADFWQEINNGAACWLMDKDIVIAGFTPDALTSRASEWVSYGGI